MKPLLIFSGIIFFKSLNLFSEVTFSFIYADQPGTGFHIKPEAQKSLEEVGQLIGGHWLKNHDAHIIVKVVSQEKLIDKKSFLASTKLIEIKNKNDKSLNYYHTYLARKIILKDSNNDRKYDMHLTVNLKPRYSYKDSVNSNEYDFKYIIIHEFTHALGFSSSFLPQILSDKMVCPNNLQEVLEDNIERFLHKLFRFGINDIEGKPQFIDATELQKELSFYESLHIDIDKIIHERNDSTSEILMHEALLNKMFKEELQTQTSSSNRFKLSKQFINTSATLEISLEEFIQYQIEDVNTLFEVFEFGVKKLMNIEINPNEEAKLKKHHSFYSKLKGDWQDRLEIEKKDFDSNLFIIHEVLIFCEQYFNGKVIHEAKKAYLLNLMKNQADSFGMSIEEYSEFFNLNKKFQGYTYFDKFVVTEDGKPLFDQEVEKHLIEYCFSKKGFKNKRNHKRLYFKGPNVLKYIGSPIPLNGLDVSHISRKEKSIMSPSLNDYGFKPREWDGIVTAIMLDLGYTIDNYWTRLWNISEKD